MSNNFRRGSHSGPRCRGGGNRGGSNRGGGFSADRGDISSRSAGRGGFYNNSSGSSAPFVVHSSWVNQSVEPVAKKSRSEFGKMEAGTVGEPVKLLANFFELKTKGLIVYHYNLDISKAEKKSETTSTIKVDKADELADNFKQSFASPSNLTKFENFIRRMAPNIVKAFISEHSALFKDVHYVHDGHKNLYTAKKVNTTDVDYVQEVEINGQMNKFNIQIQEVATIDLGEVNRYYDKTLRQVTNISEKVISVYDVIFRNLISNDPQLIANGRHFYNLQNTINNEDLPKYLKVINGFTTSVRMTEFGLALNIHLKTNVMLKENQTIEQLITAICCENPNFNLEKMQPNEMVNVNRIIRSLKICVKNMKDATGKPISRVYSVQKLLLATPYEYKFKLFDGTGEQLISDYYREKYGMNKLKHYPLLQTTGKQLVFPLELCELLPNQFLADPDSDQSIQDVLIKVSDRSPDVYFNLVVKIAERINTLNPLLLTAFGITSLADTPVRCTGRVLPAPSLLNKKITLPNGFSFTEKFFEVGNQGKAVTNWAFISLDTQTSRLQLDKFVNLMIDAARKCKLNFKKYENNNNIEIINIGNFSKISAKFAELKKKTCQFVFVYLPTGKQTKILYEVVKALLDLDYALPHQCINYEKLNIIETIGRGDKGLGYFHNFLLSVNAKLGGINNVADRKYLFDFPASLENSMIIGVDVNHPGNIESIPSSIAAAVGFIDNDMVKFRTSLRVQRRARDETVDDLKSMIAELLEDYKIAKKKLPTNLIIFRDGVSEGQFRSVITKEVTQIQAAIERKKTQIKWTAKINLTVIVVQKRHHTRFSLVTPGSKQTYNVPSGTVVDTLIVEPHIEGFILNSHFSQIGTSKPSKYIILRDDLNVKADQLQKFCFFTCNNAQQTDKILSIPTAVKLADMAAYRAKDHFDGKVHMGRHGVVANEARNGQSANTNQTMVQFNQMIKVPEATRVRPYFL